MSEPQYIHIPRWSDFQHHKNRVVPWIKDYGRQLSDDRWRDLTFHQRGILESLRLEYLRTQGRGIRDTTATLTRRLGQRVLTRDIEALNHAGLIVLSSRENLERVYDRREEKREPPFTPHGPAAVEEEVPFSVPPTKQPRRRDELFDEVTLVLGIDPAKLTPSGRGPLNRALAELRSVGATAEQIRPRVEVYVKRFPDAHCTASALAKHWASLSNGNGNGGPQTASTRREFQH